MAAASRGSMGSTSNSSRHISASARGIRVRPAGKLGSLLAAVLGVWLLAEGTAAWTAPGAPRLGRRVAAMGGVLGGLSQTAPALAEKKQDVPPGYVPAGMVAKSAGEQIVTPNGLKYSCIEPGTTEEGPRNGPPRSGSTVWVKFAGHVNAPDGPVFDSSYVRGMRRASKQEFVEIRLNLEPSLPNGMFEALKLMKVGAKGKFEMPPGLSYKDGKVGFSGDEELEVKDQIPAGATLYYDVELVKIVKP